MLLLVGPVDLVVGAVGLDGALLEVAALGLHRPEAAHVELPEVHAGIALDDPVGERLAGAARGGDAGGEAAGEVEIVELGRAAHDRLAVGGDRDRPVDDGLDAGLVEHRQAVGGEAGEERQPVVVGVEQLAAEIERRQAAPAAARAVLPAADGEAAGIGLEVEVVVRDRAAS